MNRTRVTRFSFGINEEEGAQAVKDIGLPAILRPSFTLAGTGGGIAYNIDEFNEILRNTKAACWHSLMRICSWLENSDGGCSR